MQKVTKRKITVFLAGLLIVSSLTAVGSLAFSAADLVVVLRNITITDAAFLVLYVAWVKLHKGYEQIYKSGLEFEEGK